MPLVNTGEHLSSSLSPASLFCLIEELSSWSEFLVLDPLNVVSFETVNGLCWGCVFSFAISPIPFLDLEIFCKSIILSHADPDIPVSRIFAL